MHFNAMRMRQADKRFDLLYIQNCPSAAVMRVFDAEKGCRGRVFIAAIGDANLNLVKVKHTLGVRGNDIHRRTSHR